MTALRPTMRDPMTVLLGYQARLSQIVTDMQADAKSCPVLAEHLHDAIGVIDNGRTDTVDYEIGLLEAGADKREDARERRHEAELRSDYMRGLV